MPSPELGAALPKRHRHARMSAGLTPPASESQGDGHGAAGSRPWCKGEVPPGAGQCRSLDAFAPEPGPGVPRAVSIPLRSSLRAARSIRRRARSPNSCRASGNRLDEGLRQLRRELPFSTARRRRNEHARDFKPAAAPNRLWFPEAFLAGFLLALVESEGRSGFCDHSTIERSSLRSS